MRCAVVSSSTLFKLDNWSAGHVMDHVDLQKQIQRHEEILKGVREGPEPDFNVFDSLLTTIPKARSDKIWLIANGIASLDVLMVVKSVCQLVYLNTRDKKIAQDPALERLVGAWLAHHWEKRAAKALKESQQAGEAAERIKRKMSCQTPS